MMSSARALGKDIAIYALGTFAQRAVTFFLLPLYTNVLSVADYGLFETVTVTGQILLFAMDIGMSRSVLRYYARYRDDPDELGKLFTTALSLMMLSGVGILGIGMLCRRPLSSLLFGDTQFVTVVVWLLVSSLFRTCDQWIFTLFRAKQQSIKYVLVSLINLLALTALNIAFVRYLHLGVLGILWAQALVYMAIAIVFCPTILRVSLAHFGFSWTMARQLFSFGFPLIFTTSGMLIINTIDRYFLVHYRGLEDVGIYSLGVRIAAILSMVVVTPFQLAWGPFLFGKEKENVERLISRVFTYLTLALTVSGTAFLFFGRELILFLSTEDFLAAQVVLPFMLVSVALTGLYYWAGGIVNLVEKTWILGIVVFLAGLCNVGLNFLLTPHWGWVGAAWANVLSKGMAALLALGFGMYYSRIPFERSRLVRVGLLLAGFCALHFVALSSLDGIVAIGVKMAVLALGVFLLWGPLRFSTRQERQQLMGVLVNLKDQVSRRLPPTMTL